MRANLFLLLIVTVFMSLNGCVKEKGVPAASRGTGQKPLATIGNYSLYEDDLLSEVELYPPSYRNSIGKEDILDDLIDKKILLMEAIRQNLDKKPEFMRMVQRFWEQSLLRSLLDEKSKELLSSQDTVSPEAQKKASLAMENWVNDLKKNLIINVNKELLNRIEIK